MGGEGVGLGGIDSFVCAGVREKGGVTAGGCGVRVGLNEVQIGDVEDLSHWVDCN